MPERPRRHTQDARRREMESRKLSANATVSARGSAICSSRRGRADSQNDRREKNVASIGERRER
eukprot:6210556-Pleurochrysis_carterae.AAC.2